MTPDEKEIQRQLLIQRALDVHNDFVRTAPVGSTTLQAAIHHLYNHVQKQNEVILNLVAFVADTKFV